MCCCQIPPYEAIRISPRETGGSPNSTWMWACFAVGIALLSLSLATGVLVAVSL
jgi:hypothetical protein